VKVCFVTNIYPPTSSGGPGEVVYNLQKYFLEHGVEAFVFTCGAYDQRYPNTIRTGFGKRLFFPLSPFYYFKQIQKMHFDILNFHLESGMCLAPFLFLRTKPKIVTTLHSEYLIEANATRSLAVDGLSIARPSVDEWLVKYGLVPIKLVGTYLDIKVSDRVIAVSEKTREYYLNQHQIPKEKVSIIYNGVDIEKFSPKISGEQIKKKYSIGNSKLILAVSSGTVLKGIVFVFLALKEIVKEIPSVKLMVIGIEDKYQEQMSSTINRLQIQKNVILVGRVPNSEMPQYYASSDVVVLPSLHENFPVVALEAISSGKPVIASRVGGIPELISNNENGILVSPGDIEQMVEALFRLLENSSLGNRMGYVGRKMAEEEFDWKKIGQLYLTEFEKLV
jgi:glycosyltransferase involved in cell wall biosynthesis